MMRTANLTPHISCSKEDIAPTVLMPGDPLRSKFIADTYLERAELVNNVRGIQGYTGYYHDKRVTVMASGMGIPSMGIYSYELYNVFNVQTIIRVGTAGGIHPRMKLRDLVVVLGTCTDSSCIHQFGLQGTFSPIATYELVQAAVSAAKSRGLNPAVGNILTTDYFYNDARLLQPWVEMGVLAVEMEAAGLYINAARAGKSALALCTVSDLPFTGEECTALERETSFTAMVEIALEIA